MIIYQGESFEINLDVVDGSGQPADLSGAAAVFRLRGINDTVYLEKTGVISGSAITVELTPTDTDMTCGFYTQEWRITGPAGDVKTVYQGELTIKASIFGGGNG